MNLAFTRNKTRINTIRICHVSLLTAEGIPDQLSLRKAPDEIIRTSKQACPFSNIFTRLTLIGKYIYIYI